ncbi:MAG: magnesium-transporting ATPase (P-type) [Polaribacter sp.]|jgi:magnesium-transporting ATPase (P-type)
MKSNKILSIIIALVALVGAFLFIRIFMEDAEAIETNVDLQNKVISPIIYYSTFLLIATVVITVVLSLWSLIRNPENLKKTLMGLGVLAVLLIVSYFLSDSEAVINAAGGISEGGEAGSSVNKWVGTGIWYSLILGAVASFFFVYDLVKGLIKS